MEHVIGRQHPVAGKDRINGKLTGTFFILATVTAIIGMKLYDPILITGDFLLSGAANRSQIILGGIFELMLFVSMASTAIMLFPYLRKYDGRFALGYLVFRLTEGLLILIGIISVLALVTISESFVAGGGAQGESYRAVGIALKAIHDWTFILGPCFMLGINTSIYSYVFYRTRLVPRSLAAMGLAGAVLILASGTLAMFDLVPLFSTGAILMALPIALYEMILAGWLIAKGFAVIEENVNQDYPSVQGQKEVGRAVAGKSILAIFIVLAASIGSFAQTSYVTLVVNTTGVNLNYGAMNGQVDSFKKSLRGLRAGVSVQAGITDRFSLVGEVYYAMKGGTLNAGNALTLDKTTLKLYSAEMPLLARFHFGHFYVNSGPYVSYQFSGKTESDGPDGGSVSFGSQPGGFRRFEMGVQAGAGYVFDWQKKRNKNKKLAIDIRYGHGLTSLSNDIQRYNRMLSISVYVFKPFNRTY